MAVDQPLAGAGIVLPTPCAGPLLPGIDLRCHQDAEVACWGPVTAADGSPVVALITVCRHHVRPAMRWLKSSTLDPDGIEAWRLDVFVEHQGLIAMNGIDVHVLSEVA